MKTKIKTLLLFSLIASFATKVANAQDVLTVYDGTALNRYVPAYVYYFDDFTRSQFVIPASDLGDMSGAPISSIKFYTAEDYIPYTSESTVDVYLMEVNYTTITALEPKTNATIVYQGTLDFVEEGDGGSLTINIASPYSYTYQGGNLLIGIENTTDEDDAEIYFYGRNVTGASWAGYNSSSLGNVTGIQRNFIPKTTFTYTGNGCENPTTATVTNINSTSATFNWTGGSGTYNVQYKKTSDNQWTSRVANYNGYGVALTELATNTAYQARVQSVCEGNAVSGWKSESFNTLASIPFFEEFTASTKPIGWETHHGLLSTIIGGGTWYSDESYWNFGSTSNGVFDKHASINVFGTSRNDWIITPSIPMESGVKLSFDLALTGYSGTQAAPETDGTDDRFVVLVTTDNCATWTILREWNNTGSAYVYNNIAHTANGQTEIIDLGNYSSGSIRIAFYAESTESNADNNLHLDNVSIDYCAKPANFTCIGTTNTTATFNWEGEANSWQIVLNDDFDHPYNTSNNPPYTISGLTAGTTYTAKIRAYAGYQHYSQWTYPISFMTSFCAAEDQCQITYTLGDSGNNGWDDAAISVIDVASDMTIAVITLENGSSLDGTLTVCNGRELLFEWEYGDYDYECSYVFRDINGEVIFQGSDEMEEDVEYTVDCTITDCRKPTFLDVTDIANHSVTLSWVENSDATAWVIAYETETSNGYLEVDAPTNPFTLQNLDPETNYGVKVRPVCDVNNRWSEEIYFTTDVPCPAPTALTVSDITPFTATFGWTSNVGNYDVRYGEYPESTAQSWLTYNVTPTTAYGGSTAATRTWAVMYPADMVTGNCLTKIRFYENQYFTNNITINVYAGGDYEPENLLFTTTIPPKGTTGWEEITLPEAILNIEGRNLWISLTTTGTYVMAAGLTDEYNDKWRFIEGEWSVTSGFNYGWAIEGYMETLDLNAVSWITQTCTANTCPMTGLNPEMAYIAQVKANCGGEDGESVWAGTYFETIATCTVPEGLTVSGVTGRNATFTWDAEDGATFQYCVIENPVEGYVPSDAEFVGVTNDNTVSFVHAFTPDTDYVFYLRKDCGDNDFSHVVSVAFHTTIPCPAPTNLVITDITPTTANASWTCSTGSYDIRYGHYPESVDPTWLTYNVNYQTTYGYSSATTQTWGVMYPGSEITGNVLSKIELYEGNKNTGDITVKVYSGGDNAPGTLLYTEVFTPLANGLHVVALEQPVFIVPGENLWITLTEYGTHIRPCGPCNDDNNRWFYTGGTWTTWTTGVNNSLGWIINGYMETLDFGSVAWTTATGTEDTYLMTGLTHATPYVFEVRSNCGTEDGESEWVPAYFTTNDGVYFMTDGNWNDGANWYFGAVPDDNSDVTIGANAIIPAGFDAKVNNITINNGSITIKDGGQLHSNVAVQATVEKTITGYTGAKDHYYLIANPLNTSINPETFGLTNGTFDLYRFDGAQTGEEWRNYETTPFNMTAGIGYLYANAEDLTLQFTGTVRKQYTNLFYNNTTLTYDTEKPFGIWNLVGNMFPHNCYVYIGTLSGNSVNLSSTYYYRMNEIGSELVVSDEVVKPGEGIFVQSTTDNQYAFVSSVKRDGYALGLRMNLTQGNKLIDAAIIHFGESEHLEKFQLNSCHTKLYIPKDNKNFAVVSADATGEMPVSFKAAENGNYTINVNVEHIDLAYLHLIDNLTGADVDLLENPSYTFTAKTTDYASRFRLVFSNSEDTNGDNDMPFAFINNGNIIVNGEGTLQVIDVMGRVVLSGDAIHRVSTGGMAAGVYVLRLINGDDVKTQKIVIR